MAAINTQQVVGNLALKENRLDSGVRRYNHLRLVRDAAADVARGEERRIVRPDRPRGLVLSNAEETKKTLHPSLVQLGRVAKRNDVGKRNSVLRQENIANDSVRSVSKQGVRKTSVPSSVQRSVRSLSESPRPLSLVSQSSSRTSRSWAQQHLVTGDVVSEASSLSPLFVKLFFGVLLLVLMFLSFGFGVSIVSTFDTISGTSAIVSDLSAVAADFSGAMSDSGRLAAEFSEVAEISLL